MHKTKYVLVTPYGNRYELDVEGHVLRYSNGLNRYNATMEELGTWKVAGLRQIGPFNRLGHLIPLAQAVKITDWSFKNGKPRYTAQDLDHGTTRVWGNWNLHGIRSLWEV